MLGSHHVPWQSCTPTALRETAIPLHGTLFCCRTTSCRGVQTVALPFTSIPTGVRLDFTFSFEQDDIMPRYSELVYNGFWFSPERLALQVSR